MSVRITRGVIAALLLAFVVVALWRALAGGSSDKDLPNPLVHGKPLSMWMQKAFASDDTAEVVEALKPFGTEAAPHLSRALRHKDTLFNTAYVKVWAKLPGTIQRRLAKPILARDIRLRAVVLMREIGSPAKAAIPDLINQLSDKDESIRLQSVLALGYMGPDAKNAVPSLKTFLNGKRDDVRAYAARGLWKITWEAEPSLSILEAVLAQTNEVGRLEAASFLGEMGSTARPAIPLLAQTVHASDKDLASLSVQALGEIGMETFPILTNVLSDPNPTMRGSAALVLGKLGPKTKEAAPLLTHLLEDNATCSPLFWGVPSYSSDGMEFAAATADHKPTLFRWRSVRVSDAAGAALAQIVTPVEPKARLPFTRSQAPKF